MDLQRHERGRDRLGALIAWDEVARKVIFRSSGRAGNPGDAQSLDTE